MCSAKAPFFGILRDIQVFTAVLWMNTCCGSHSKLMMTGNTCFGVCESFLRMTVAMNLFRFESNNAHDTGLSSHHLTKRNSNVLIRLQLGQTMLLAYCAPLSSHTAQQFLLYFSSFKDLLDASCWTLQSVLGCRQLKQRNRLGRGGVGVGGGRGPSE